MPRKANKRPRSRKKNQTLVPTPRRGLGLIFWGAVLLVIFTGYRIYSSNILRFGAPAITNQVFSGPAPVKIDIPQINLHLPITEATVTDGSWEISPDGASHWDNSANPGETGNIVIY
ncbi:MAG: hypothetical protein U1C50_01390, partial [Patescibacteria group bacterium]|nr:hypothetical protein [Patescibacteria group bacterium]